MATSNSSTTKPRLIARAIRKNAPDERDIAELWEAGSEIWGFSATGASDKQLDAGNQKSPKPIAAAPDHIFSDSQKAQDWFAQHLVVQNENWLEVHLGSRGPLHSWVTDRLSFEDVQSVDIEALAEEVGDFVEDWALEGLRELDLVWKPARVWGYLAIGIKTPADDISWFYFNDEAGEFEFTETLATFSWFMDSTGAPISWVGGSQIGFLDPAKTLLGVAQSGDEDSNTRVWTLKPEWTIAGEIGRFFAFHDPPHEHMLFLELGMIRADGVFTDDEWSMMTEIVSESKDEGDGWMACSVVPEHRDAVHLFAIEHSKLYKALNQFISEKNFPRRDLILKSWDQLVTEINGYVWEDLVLHGNDVFGVLKSEI
jgi:hypothetical protein